MATVAKQKEAFNAAEQERLERALAEARVVLKEATEAFNPHREQYDALHRLASSERAAQYLVESYEQRIERLKWRAVKKLPPVAIHMIIRSHNQEWARSIRVMSAKQGLMVTCTVTSPYGRGEAQVAAREATRDQIMAYHGLPAWLWLRGRVF